MRITSADLKEKLARLDDRMLSLWLVDETSMSDDDLWEIVVVLLETRVEIIKCCRDAGVQLSQQDCVPEWLVSLLENRKEMRLREIRKMSFDLQIKKKIASYDVNSKMFGSSSEVAP